MRTNIDIDDDLLAKAFAATGLKTKREVVEEGLRQLAQNHAYQELRRLRGKLNWVGDLDAMRRD